MNNLYRIEDDVNDGCLYVSAQTISEAINKAVKNFSGKIHYTEDNIIFIEKICGDKLSNTFFE